MAAFMRVGANSPTVTGVSFVTRYIGRHTGYAPLIEACALPQGGGSRPGFAAARLTHFSANHFRRPQSLGFAQLVFFA